MDAPAFCGSALSWSRQPAPPFSASPCGSGQLSVLVSLTALISLTVLISLLFEMSCEPRQRLCHALVARPCHDRRVMRTDDVNPVLGILFAELVDGAPSKGGAYMLNGGDRGLLRSLEQLTASDASRSVNDGATIAAHAQHVRYGLSLMNRWAREGGNPFADATWDAAWKTREVGEREWDGIRRGLRDEAHRWLEVLKTPRETSAIELAGMIGSIGHLAYHLGAIRQINKDARGPKEGTF
jgi:hypothetical protein